MLRAAFVIICLAVGIRYSFRGPFYALLLYVWLAYFRPDQWLWSDFILPLKIPLLVGAWVILGTAMSSERARLPGAYWLIPALTIHSLVSTLLSAHSDYALTYWIEFAKIAVVCTVIVFLVNTEARLKLTLIIMALSLGLESAKQGLSNLVINPGGQNINTSTMLGDNNGVAVGMAMLVPIVYAVASTAPVRWHRLAGYGVAVGVLFRAIFTYSRGGFLAILAVGVHFLLRSKHRIAALAAATVLAAITASVLPQQFWERMGTIPTSTAEVDVETMERSAASRLHFWTVAVHMANANPILGVGHNAYNQSYNQYDSLRGEFGRGRSVHSAWFGILAELGYVGFGMFVALFVGAFVALRRTVKLAASLGPSSQLGAYALGLEAALIAYVVGASFVPHQYNEFAWHLLALSIATGRIARDAVAGSTPEIGTDQPRPTIPGSTWQPRTMRPASRESQFG